MYNSEFYDRFLHVLYQGYPPNITARTRRNARLQKSLKADLQIYTCSFEIYKVSCVCFSFAFLQLYFGVPFLFVPLLRGQFSVNRSI